MEIHGLIGYNMLAKYRMEIDFTRDKMIWTELDFEPKLEPMGGKGGKGGGQGGLEIIGGDHEEPRRLPGPQGRRRR